MHVLLVDDEPLAREELSYLVSQHPAVTSVTQAEGVLEAMSKMMEQKPVSNLILFKRQNNGLLFRSIATIAFF